MGKTAIRILILALLFILLILLVPSSTPVAIGEGTAAIPTVSVERAV